MILDIARFNRNAVAMSGDTNMTISELLDKMKMGKWFRDYYLLPISGAIWSSTPEQIGEFPARSLVQFFENHALLTTNNHQWYTVDGGSIEYVNRIADAIKANSGNIVTGAPITHVRRTMDGVLIGQNNGTWEEFDQVIFACHSDDALALLEAPTEDETRILSKMRYQDNHAVLHRDENQMPQRKDCWSSWVFQSADNSPAPAIGITYWMNSLQDLNPKDHLFVTLNPKTEIPTDLIYEETVFRHPVFDREAIGAQKELKQIQGLNRTWFCGAYTRHGFHEDGYASAVDVATKIREKVTAK
jgi:predicted NAD/FAD-binding protein